MKHDDVYLLSVHEMLEWVRDPHDLKDVLKQFAPWNCTVLEKDRKEIDCDTNYDHLGVEKSRWRTKSGGLGRTLAILELFFFSGLFIVCLYRDNNQ